MNRENGHQNHSGRVPVFWALAFLGGVLLAGGCGVPGADGPADTFGVDFSLPEGSTARGAVVFYVDGVNADIFREMLEAGELPAIKEHFADRGLYVQHAVANIPSVTLANLTSFVTGKFPGHHGVTGINWFDRNRLIWRNYETIAQKNTLDGDYTAATIYEQFPEETTVSLFFQAHRGATYFIENWMSAGPPFFFGWYEFVDRLTLFRFHIVSEVARERRSFPVLTVAYLLAADFRAYRHGVSSEQYRDALKHTDYQIGRVLGDLKRAGLLDKLYIVFVSDHGLGDVEKHFDVEDFLRKQVGLSVAPGRLWENVQFRPRLRHYRKYNCVPYGSGDRYWSLCLRRPVRDEGGKAAGFSPWPVRPTAEDLKGYPAASGPVNLPDVLASQEAVDAVAYSAGENRIRVLRKSGEVEFHQPGGPGGLISCRVLSGDDPLGWLGDVPAGALAGKLMSPREWLTVTCETQFPDLPAQITAYFRARRAGDVVVFAAPGWDFNNRNRAGHGGIRPADMHVPLLIAGPGVPRGWLKAVRTADVMPSLLQLLGKEPPAGLDGRSFLPQPPATRPK